MHADLVVSVEAKKMRSEVLDGRAPSLQEYCEAARSIRNGLHLLIAVRSSKRIERIFDDITEESWATSPRRAVALARELNCSHLKYFDCVTEA